MFTIKPNAHYQKSLLLDNYSEVPLLRGSKSITLTAHLHTPPDHTHSCRPILFPSDSANDCPLDIIVNLMVWTFLAI